LVKISQQTLKIIILKKILILTFLNIILNQNFNYQPGDWFMFIQPGSINCITETSSNVMFGTDNGIFYQDKFNYEINYDSYNSNELQSKKIHHIIYDKNTDYYWLVNEDGINYKASISKYWNVIPFYKIGINSPFQIINIGYNSESIWIKTDFGIIPLNRYNGSRESLDLFNEIEWGSSKIQLDEKIDLFNYNFNDSWLISNDKIYNTKNNLEYHPIVMYKNTFGETWVGTSSGLVFYGKYGWLNPYYLGMAHNNITEIYFDNQNTWWFGESYLRNNYNKNIFGQNFLNSGNIFLSSWNENENIWEYYYSNESLSIKNTDINKILRHNSKVYLGTMKGILVLDIIERSWKNISKDLNDEAIWDLIIIDNSLLVATARGINEISLLENIVIPNKNSFLDEFNNKEIYKFILEDQILYVSFSGGLAKIDFINEDINYISNKRIKDFQINQNRIFINDSKIYQIIAENKLKPYNLILDKGFDFCVSEEFIWTFTKNELYLYNMKKNIDWSYDYSDGIFGDFIYTLDCDDQWIWFSTNKGVFYYNWGVYHK